MESANNNNIIIILTCNWEHSKFGVSSMCWRSRPGVQTKMFRSLTCSFSMSTSLRPPIRRPALKPWCFPTDLRTSKSWLANSLVGDIIMLPTPSCGPHLCLYNFSRTWNILNLGQSYFHVTQRWKSSESCCICTNHAIYKKLISCSIFVFAMKKDRWGDLFRFLSSMIVF